MDTKQMNAEWNAWQKWHKEFKTLTGRDINHSTCNKFVALTRIWGEQLVLLREAQSPQVHSENIIREEQAKLDAPDTGDGPQALKDLLKF